MVDATQDWQAALDAAPAPDVQATFCATLVDQWLSRGVRHAVVAPGSRSTPMALAVAARAEIVVHVVHDERVAAFVALGIGLSGTPALLLCTSGTATANFFPAVVEAGLSGVSMIVLTADRPDELRGVGAPQTIDQIDLYGRHVRWSLDPGVPEASSASTWRPLADRAVERSRSGPVQLNLAFREPLVGTACELPPAREEPAPAPATQADDDGISAGDPPPGWLQIERGVVLVGGASGVDGSDVAELSRRTGWPILADAMSGVRHLDGAVSTADALLRDADFADRHAAEVIVRIGRPASSKVLAQWSARPDVVLVQVGGPGRIDPARNVTAVRRMDELLADAPDEPAGTAWRQAWIEADARADAAIRSTLESSGALTEPAVARILADERPVGSDVTVSSSMPVRDFEWFGGPRAACHCNRGANGIDGVVSTALGRALEHGGTEFVLVGDLAFVHDSNALVSLLRRDVDLRVVVVDNDGGGIFSFLPQATVLGGDRFEQLFGTPTGTDVAALAAAHGVPTATATTRADLVGQLAVTGPWVCRVATDRSANVAFHRRLDDAVRDALR